MKVLTVLLLGVSVAGIPADKYVLKPYSFKDYERYIYDYSEVFRGSRNRGRFEITIERKEDGFRVSIIGGYREWNGAVSGVFKDAKEVAGFVLMRMYFDHPWLIPLGRTVFSRALVKVLTSKVIDWSPGIKEIGKDTVRVVRKCNVGGLKGNMLEILRKREVVFKICVSPSASLPTYIYRKTEDLDVYELKLFEYSDLK
jgi:hypothetical protein